MIRLIPVAALSLLLALAPTHAQEGVVSDVPHTHDQLTRALDDALAASGIPGAQIALIENGEVSLSYTYGIADREAGTPVTTETVFRAGSISKSFVGVAMMMAVEDGLLTLETPITEAAPDVQFINPWEDIEPLTLAHALEHTAGFYDIALREFLISDPISSVSDGLAVNPRNRISRWRPGTYMSYSNSGPPIAARALEIVRGQDYDSLLRETVLRPLGMGVSDLQLTPEVERRLSRSYTESLDEPIPYFHILMRPSGAFNTTALELAEFVRMLIGRGQVDGVRLLSPASVARLERAETLEAIEFYGLDQTYGLGNSPVYAETLVMRGHGGAIDGFLADYAYAAELGGGYVILVNSDNGAAAQSVETLLQDYLLRDYEPQLPPVHPVDESELEQYAGFYVSRTARGRFEEALAPFASMTRAAYSGETGLRVAGVRRIPNGEHTMRRAERAGTSFARAYGNTYRRELRYATSTLVQLPLWEVVARIAIPLGLAVGAVMALGYEIFRIPLFFIRKARGRPRPPRQRGPRGLRSLAVLSSFSLIALVFIFFDLTQRHYTRLHELSEVTPLTMGIFALTIAVPVFAALGLLTALASPGEAGWGKRGYHIVATGLILIACVWLAQWGWIGLRVWTF